MLNFMIVVDDGGELKTISRAELAGVMPTDPDGMPALDEVINMILDQRAIAAGEYDPSDNDTPIEVTMSGDYVEEPSNHGVPADYDKDH